MQGTIHTQRGAKVRYRGRFRYVVIRESFGGSAAGGTWYASIARRSDSAGTLQQYARRERQHSGGTLGPIRWSIFDTVDHKWVPLWGDSGQVDVKTIGHMAVMVALMIVSSWAVVVQPAHGLLIAGLSWLAISYVVAYVRATDPEEQRQHTEEEGS